ncbi:MAG: translation initiation factor IF-1 [Patescibacteria group bacterium]|nr:translation initiation factor IF-1 [Patescibacteria group bacterium]MDE1988587.1 translation initiation factor IF-1 [Patescibacteria group bacterium]MDE2217955.1 translation initiation factor IF-1 [Patescibacteria group bacterium]
MENKKAKDKVAASGVIIEAFPNALFKVKLEKEGAEILAYLSGKMRMNRIRVLIGDKIIVELDEYGGKGRIVKRI